MPGFTDPSASGTSVADFGERAALLRELRGDLHVHTTWSDGTASLDDMVLAAVERGHEYLAITDHSPRLKVANGLSAERLLAQRGAIEQAQTRLDAAGADLRILPGIEVDILPDGRLDQSDAALDELSVVVASVHSRLRDDAATMTGRMVAAIANPHTNILGHVTGRLVRGERGTRPPSTFDAEVVFEACRAFGVALEINSRPEREDPSDELLALALESGCLFSIDTDAHAPRHLGYLELGAERAARVGIPAERIITTWPLADLLAFCAKG